MKKELPSLQNITGPTQGQALRKRIFKHQGVMIGSIFISLVILLLYLQFLTVHVISTRSLIKITPPVWHEKGSWDIY